MEIKKTKKLAEGNEGELLYFGCKNESLCDLHEITRSDTTLLSIFFRAKTKKLITGNVVSVKGKCIGDTPFYEIPIGKKVKFIAGDPMKFWGTRIGVVKIKRYRYLEIEIIPGELYFYSHIDGWLGECELLKLAT